MGDASKATFTTLGVTATLALLWLLAAASGGPQAPAALALDPGRAGSIGAWWGGLQLVAALAAAGATPALRPFTIAPAALLAGEVGELHIHAAHLLADMGGDAALLLPLKAAAALCLGAVALGAVWRLRHEACSARCMALMIAAGAWALAVDCAQMLAGSGAWLEPIEEWSELVACSALAGIYLRMSRSYWFGTTAIARGTEFRWAAPFEGC